MLDFGSFDTRWDALIAACPLILSMPGGHAGRQDSMGFDVRWRVSREYCSWLYYTPDQKYEPGLFTKSGRSLALLLISMSATRSSCRGQTSSRPGSRLTPPAVAQQGQQDSDEGRNEAAGAYVTWAALSERKVYQSARQ